MPLDISTVRITPEILALVAEIDEFKGLWRAAGRIAPERLSSLRRVATIESIGSSTCIEGAKLSDRDVERLLSNLDIKAFATREEQEVAGYAAVMETVFGVCDAIALTANHIRQLHRDLLVHSTKDERHKGGLEDARQSCRGLRSRWSQPRRRLRRRDAVRLAAADDRTRRMVARSRSGQGSSPLARGRRFRRGVSEIYPFQDANGRLSQILTTLLSLRTGHTYAPYNCLESLIEQSTEGYYLALRRTRGAIRTASPDWAPRVEFFLRALQQQKRRLEAKMERERVVLGALPELSVAILELERERGRVTVMDAARVTGANRNTVKDHLQALVDVGHLIRHGAGRGAWYGLV